ncbi:lysine N(6)-hydroxylase/L-ornithine N(5)-oxygenase family protein [Streptomyces sp. NPDC050658]|uniref:lysine N(6)-hydroxylase/L-ornithine N(5)-oxygenase family protein n=1 Tax=unclassified Streptomyces TaxID=2593676 RepID=UPI00343CE794
MTDTPLQDGPPAAPLDLLGIGVGPFNLALAALAEPVADLDSAFFEQRAEFRWHPGMMIEGATIQVPFLADLVTLADPASRWSFLSYLKAHDRLFPFYFAERFHIPRAEYEDYCRWVSRSLTSCHFGRRVGSVHWDPDDKLFQVETSAGGPESTTTRHAARNIVLGVGTEPTVPACLRSLTDDPNALVLHAADYLTHRRELEAAGDVTVVGSGQSGAEIVLDLLRRRPRSGGRLRWLARTPAFAPMEYSKLGLEHFTPDYIRYFHSLAPDVRAELVPQQWQLYKGISERTLADLHSELYERSIGGSWPDVTLTPGVAITAARRLGTRVELDAEARRQGRSVTFPTDAVVLATGYTERPMEATLAPLADHLVRDSTGGLDIGLDYRVRTDDTITGSIFVQNAERHTHGVGAPDLGLAAWRAAVIVNEACERDVYALPGRTAFTRFGISDTPVAPQTIGTEP